MKFCFSSMLMTSWLCQKSRSMKDFEICWRLNSRSKSSKSPTHTGCPCWVCEEWDFTLSTPVYWRIRTHFLLPQRKQGLQPSGAPLDSKKASGIWRCNLLPGQDQIFHIPCQFFRNFFPNPARRHWTLARRVANYLKTTQDSVLFLSSQQGGPVTSSPMLKAAVNSELLTFTDSDFAFCEKTRKSSLIYWKPGKQNHVSRSTTEAEFYAFLEGITEVEFLQDVIHFAYKVDKRIFNCKNTPIFCDNSSAGKIANSIESIARTKHIEVWQVSLYRKKSNSQPLPRRGTTTLKFCGSYACKT